MNSPVIDRPTRPAPPLPDLSFVKSRRLNVKTPQSRSDSQLVRKRSASRELQDAVRARAEKNRRQNRRSWLLSRVSDVGTPPDPAVDLHHYLLLRERGLGNTGHRQSGGL